MKTPASLFSLLLLLLAFTACTDAPTVTPPEEPQSTEVAPPLDVPATLHSEGYPNPGEVRTGYIRDWEGDPREVTYEVHDGRAIWQGDIILGAADKIPGSLNELLATAYGVVIDGSEYRWPGGVVPYVYTTGFVDQSRVEEAMDWIEDQTPGVRFVYKDGHDDYLKFVDGDGCSSFVGMQGGDQDVELSIECSVGNAAHEMLHALGMFHEQSRCDRDTWVTINWSNIEEDAEHNFEKECDDASDYFAYDYGSMMHYGPFAFAEDDNVPTIIAKFMPEGEAMGQRDALGPTDIQTIQYFYGSYNQAPVAVIHALEPSYDEGSYAYISAHESYDPDDHSYILTYDWTLGDGTCTDPSPPPKCTALTVFHPYADDGSYPITLVVSDGFASMTTSATALVLNVPPSVNVGADAEIDEGDTFEREGSFEDPGADTWEAWVDYGDGGGPMPLPLAGDKTFDLSHTFVDNGLYTVAVGVGDDDGGTGEDALQLTVLNVPPTVNAGPDAEVLTGEYYNFSGTFSDPGLEDDPWNWVISWGDGDSESGSTDDQYAPITATHRVCTAGDYTVTLTVTDKDGGAGSDDLILTVPFLMVDIQVEPGENANPLNLKRGGVVPVAIFSTYDFDAAEIDPASLRMGDVASPSVPAVSKNNGTIQATLEDVDQDGLLDMVVMFPIPDLVTSGEVTELTTEVSIEGYLNDACTNIKGVGHVTIRPM